MPRKPLARSPRSPATSLLREAHGEKRLFRFLECPHIDDPSLTELGHDAQRCLRFDAAAPAVVVEPADHQHNGTDGKNLIDIEAHALPHITEVARVVPYCVVAAVHTSLAKCCKDRV